MQVSIIGTGYVGLVTGVCLAEKGHQVVCVDLDAEKVNKINRAIPPIFENGLSELLQKNVNQKLRATTDLREAVLNTELSVVAVGTPFNGDTIDLTFIENVSAQIGAALLQKNQYHLVVVKSTVIPGTTDKTVIPILEQYSGKKAGPDFGVGMNPEFLREGHAVADFMAPDRIVIGGLDEKSRKKMQELYVGFEGVPKIETNNQTAEMIKYTSNSLLATMISFSNEIANLCATLGNIDVVEVMRGVHLDKRLSPILANGERIRPDILTYLEAGCGFGGSCFPKDVKSLAAQGRKLGQSMPLLEAVLQVNAHQPQQVLSRLKKHFPNLKGLQVVVLGLAFKAGTDDMRESPAIPIIEDLLAQQVKIKAYDPVAISAAHKFFGNHQIRYFDDMEQAIQNVQAILLLTRQPEFERLPQLLQGMQSQPLFIDGRRMLDKHGVARYEGIGL
ncbi:MAG: UDP-glucose dehydrogenase family protein [bacterium]